MAHEHVVYDSDPHFSIDVDTRAISYESPAKLVLIKDDHNSEVFTFDMPRYIDGHDVLLCDIKQIHYINMGSGQSQDVYEIQDLKASDDDENTVVFSWLVSMSATKYAGSLNFAIKFACSNTEEYPTYSYKWQTLPYSSVPVQDTVNSGPAVIEEHSDILQQWYNDLFDAVDGAVAEVGGIKVSTEEPNTEKAVAWLNPDTGVLRVKDENGEFQPLESIKGDKGDPGAITNITQETGDSEELVMSQYKVTAEISRLDSKIDQLDAYATGKINEFEPSIFGLQQKDTEHDTAISNLSRILSDSNVSLGSAITTANNRLNELENSCGTTIIKTGSYTGTATDGSYNPAYITIEGMDVQMIIIKDTNADPESKLRDLIVLRDYEASTSMTINSTGSTTQWMWAITELGERVSGDESSKCFTMFNFNTTNETDTIVELCGVQDLNDNSSFSPRASYNEKGTTYYWIAFGTKLSE